MKPLTWLRAATIPALLAAGAALAQSKAPIVTDIGASPAEERSSAGAIVFEDSMPRAHRRTFGVRDTRAEVQAIGQNVMRATLAEIRDADEGPNTRALGGPPAPEEQPADTPRSRSKRHAPPSAPPR
jgi:hypothetical protein